MKKLNYLHIFLLSSFAISSLAMEQEAVNFWQSGQTSDEGEDSLGGDWSSVERVSEDGEEDDNRYFISRFLFARPVKEDAPAQNSNNEEFPAGPTVLKKLLNERLEKRNISDAAWSIISATETQELNREAVRLQEQIASASGEQKLAAEQQWNLYRYNRLTDAISALIKELRKEVVNHGDAKLPTSAKELEILKRENSVRSYQYQLRAAYVAVMFTLEEFETVLAIKYPDSEPYPSDGMLAGVKTWGDKLYRKFAGYKKDEEFLTYFPEGRIPKAELARRYHLARNGLASMVEAWSKTTKTGALKGMKGTVYSVKGIAGALMAPRMAAQSASEQFKTLTAWFGAQNPASILNLSLKSMRQGKKINDAFGIIEFARTHPLIAKNLVANLNLFYQTLSIDRSTPWNEVLGEFEGVFQAKEIENIVNDFLLGTEAYLESSADITDSPLTAEMLVVCQIAESLPYFAGGYIGLTVQTGATGLAKTGVKAVAGAAFEVVGLMLPAYVTSVVKIGAEVFNLSMDAGVGVALVHLKKKAAERISRNLEITVNTLRHVTHSYAAGNKDFKGLVKEAAIYVGVREAIRQYGTMVKLRQEKRCAKECGIRSMSVYGYDSEVGPFLREAGLARAKNFLMRVMPGLVTVTSAVIGKFGLGTLARYYIEADPDYSQSLLDAAPWMTMAGAAIVLPPMVYVGRHFFDWLFCCHWSQTRSESRRLRQLLHQKSRLPVGCIKTDDDDDRAVAERYKKAFETLTEDDLIEIAEEELDGNGLNDRLTQKLIQILDADELTQEVEAELKKNNPEFKVLIDQIKALLVENLGEAEYEGAVETAIQLFKKGRPDKKLDEREKKIVGYLTQLNKLFNAPAARQEKVEFILSEINKLRIRQLKDGLQKREEERRKAIEDERAASEVVIHFDNSNNDDEAATERTPLKGKKKPKASELHTF